MKPTICFFVIVFNLLLFFSCKDNAVSTVESKHQFVIGWHYDNDPSDPDWFIIIDIRTQSFQPVPAVLELEGRYYLPIMSRMPSFNNKVVEGEFFIDQPLGSPKPDTVFRVTKHLRDTLVTN